jgi:hypothetical protein
LSVDSREVTKKKFSTTMFIQKGRCMKNCLVDREMVQTNKNTGSVKAVQEKLKKGI